MQEGLQGLPCPTQCSSLLSTASLACVQSRVSECALYSSENMLVCAPTGAGKTNVAMLCILHQLGLYRWGQHAC